MYLLGLDKYAIHNCIEFLLYSVVSDLPTKTSKELHLQSQAHSKPSRSLLSVTLFLRTILPWHDTHPTCRLMTLYRKSTLTCPRAISNRQIGDALLKPRTRYPARLYFGSLDWIASSRLSLRIARTIKRCSGKVKHWENKVFLRRQRRF